MLFYCCSWCICLSILPKRTSINGEWRLDSRPQVQRDSLIYCTCLFFTTDEEQGNALKLEVLYLLCRISCMNNSKFSVSKYVWSSIKFVCFFLFRMPSMAFGCSYSSIMCFNEIEYFQKKSLKTPKLFFLSIENI